MCYDIKASLEAQLTRARRNNDYAAMEEIIEKLAPLTDLPLHHASGFTHPVVLIYTDRSPDFPELATWGLVPHWVQDKEQLKKLWNNTLNARGETIFEKPSFRDSAEEKRCIIYVDGFYEHHHFNGKTYPFFIQNKDKTPLSLAGLWSTWKDPESGGMEHTFTIVTTVGNGLLSKIHNNPKLKGPRMPVLLSEAQETLWLHPIQNDADRAALEALLAGTPENKLTAHPVQRLRGKEYQGNIETASDAHAYEELKTENLCL